MSKVCEACGSPQPLLAEWCGSCGQKIGVSPPVPRARPVTAACPKCLQPDLVYTVRGFLEQDFSKYKSKDDEWDPASTQEFLAAPEQPRLPALRLWLVIPWIPFVNALMIWFAPLHKLYKLVLLGLAAIFVACIAIPGLYEMDAYAFVGLAMLLVYYAGLILDRGRQRRELEQVRVPEWHRMLQNWEHVCYCRRCDLAWLGPDPSRQAPPEDLKKILGQ